MNININKLIINSVLAASIFISLPVNAVSSVGTRAIAQTTTQDTGKKPCVRQELPKLKQDMPYSKAREMLLEAGWQAIFNQEQLRNSQRSSPVDYFFTKKGYTEIVDCAGTGLGLCLFQFESAYGEILSVVTANNGANQETVFRWYIEQKEQKE